MKNIFYSLILLAGCVSMNAQDLTFDAILNTTESTATSYAYDIIATNSGAVTENIATYQLKIYYEDAEVTSPVFTTDNDGDLGWGTSFDAPPVIAAASNPSVPTTHDMSIEVAATDDAFLGTDMVAGAQVLLGRITFTASPGDIDGTSAIYFGTNPETDGALFYAGNDFANHEITNDSPTQLLPIELSSFEVAKRGEDAASLTWTTETEVNASHFEVEKSYTGASFTNVGEVKAEGESKTSQDYGFIDSDVELIPNQVTIVYYRLKMVDNDGAYEYSEVKSVEFEVRNVELEIHPNPTTDFITVTADSKITGITIVDVDGKIIRDNVNYESKLDLTNLTSGMYKVLISTENGEFIKSVVKLD